VSEPDDLEGGDPGESSPEPGARDPDAAAGSPTGDPRTAAGTSDRDDRGGAESRDAGPSARRDRPSTVYGWLAAVRADPRRRLVGFAVASLVGIGLAGIHWIGLVAGGALVGTFGRDFREAVAASLAYGATTWIAFLGAAWLAGNATAVVGTGRIAVLTVLVPVALGGFGALARGLVPSRAE